MAQIHTLEVRFIYLFISLLFYLYVSFILISVTLNFLMIPQSKFG